MVDYGKLLKQLDKDEVLLYRLVAQAEAEFFFPPDTFEQETVDRIASYIYDWTCASSASAVEAARMISIEYGNGKISLEKLLDYDEETEEYLNEVISQYCY